MARPQTDSLDYYSRDTVQQDNENYIEALHGLLGWAIVEKLRQHIYGSGTGYYCAFGEINRRMFCKKIGITIDQLDEVLNTCFVTGVELFDANLYKSKEILTSVGIQKRWKRIVTDAGRKNRDINPEYNLIPPPLPTNKPPIIGGETPDNKAESTQSKVKDNKVENSKVEESKEKKENGAVLQTAQPQPGSFNEDFKKKVDRKKKFVVPVIAEVEKHFVDATNGKWRPEFAKHQAQKYFAHYTGNGWVQNKDKPIVDWKAAADGWILRTDAGDQKIGTTPVSHETKTQDQILREIEFCYQRFLEDGNKLPDLNGIHYKFLQESKKMIITEAAGKEFLSKAIEIRKKQLVGSNDGPTNRLHEAYCAAAPKFDKEPIKSDTTKLYKLSKQLIIQNWFYQQQEAGKQNLN